jgi:hypothetical protein
MPEYSCYYEDEKPFLTERYIDDIKNLKVGDYLCWNRSFDRGGGMTKAYTITKIIKNCAFIDVYDETNEYKPICLRWNDVREDDENSLVKGYLENKFLKCSFCYYVKQEEMDLTQFNRTDTLLRGCA